MLFLLQLSLVCALNVRGLGGRSVTIKALPTLGAVIVDSRWDDAVKESVVNARHHLGDRVPIYFVTTRAKIKEYGPRLRNRTDVIFRPDIDFADQKVPTYSRLLTSVRFWQAFSEDYILIFQRDSRFCSYSGRRIEDFVGQRYDYLGAPWKVVHPPGSPLARKVYGGNGGFSLRLRKTMLECSIQFGKPIGTNEDGAFSSCLKKRNATTLPSFAVASSFAVETVRTANRPLGVHKSLRYIPNDSLLATYCPEIYQTYRRIDPGKRPKQ